MKQYFDNYTSSADKYAFAFSLTMTNIANYESLTYHAAIESNLSVAIASSGFPVSNAISN